MYLLAFYILTILIAILRLYYMYCGLRELGYKREGNKTEQELWQNIQLTVSTAPFTLKLILNAFQASSMVDLVIKVKMAA